MSSSSKKKVLSCPRCNHRLPRNARFCSSCGTPIPTALDSSGTSHEEGGRRVVTVLFSDLSGYTALNQHLDPEEVEAVMFRLKQTASQIIHIHGGIVNQFIGDEIVALFGVNAAHEDDPVRAVRAALDLHATAHRIGAEVDPAKVQSLAMHSGIDTGLIVTNTKDSRDGVYGVTGDTIITAVRLRAASPCDTILISEATYNVVSPYFETSFYDELDLKGKAARVKAYTVARETAIANRFEASRKRGLTQYTARTDEIDSLKSAYTGMRTGTDLFIVVIGEAGIGKSRLLYEYTETVREDNVTVLHGNCYANTINTAYSPFLGVFRDRLSIVEGATHESLIANAGAKLASTHPALQGYLPIYLHLLSLRTDPIIEHMRAEELQLLIREALIRFFIYESERRPTILFLEDWHWTDEPSQIILQYLLQEMVGRPLMIVLTHRSEHAFEWRERPPDRVLKIPALDIDETESLLKATLNVQELPIGFAKLLYARTGGNPLFIEEASLALVEEGILIKEASTARLTRQFTASHLPTTVQAIIQSRLDRLPPDEKEVLEIASVIGRVFPLTLVQPIYKGRFSLSDAIASLIALDMVVHTEDSTYTFKHVLIQQVAYEGLLIIKRQRLHRMVAQTIERLYSERVSEYLNILYHHFRIAEEWEKVASYGQALAEKTQRLSQFQEAVTILDEATEALLRIPTSKSRQMTLVDILLLKERLFDTLGIRERQEAVIEQAYSVLTKNEDAARLATVQLRQGDLLTQLAKYLDAEEALESALVLRRQLGDRSGESNTLRSLSFLRWHQGRNREALQCNAQALEIDRSLGDARGMSHDLTNQAAVLQSLGDMETALQSLNEALALESAEDPFNAMTIFYNIANIHSKVSRYEEARKYYEKALQPCIQHRLYINQTLVLGCIASMYRKQIQLKESLNYYQQVVEISKRITYPQGTVNGLRGIADILLIENRPEEALRYLSETVHILRELGDITSEAISWEIIASIHERESESWSEAEQSWAEVRKLAQRLNDLPRQLIATEGMTRSLRIGGADKKRILSTLEESYRLAIKLNKKEDSGRFLNSMAILEWEFQNFDMALVHYQQALDIYQELKDNTKTGFILNSIAVTLRSMERFNEAMATLEHALPLHRQMSDLVLEAQAMVVMGHLHADLGHFDKAIHAYNLSLTIRHEIGDEISEGWLTYHLVRVYIRQRRLRDCKPLMDQMHEIAFRHNDEALIGACRELESMVGP
jgi:predicted ATPase/class 3 adenylate cyclase